MTNTQELHDHIVSGSYDTSDVAALAAALQAETITEKHPVLVKDLAQHADQEGLSVKLLMANYNPNLSIEGRVVVDWALALLKAKYDDFSMDSPRFLGGLQKLVDEPVFTQEDADGLLALQFTTRERWPNLTEGQVNAALLWPKIAQYEQQSNEAQAKLMLLYQGIDPDAEDAE